MSSIYTTNKSKGLRQQGRKLIGTIVSEEEHRLIRAAAGLAGVSMRRFAVDATLKAAQKVLERIKSLKSDGENKDGGS